MKRKDFCFVLGSLLALLPSILASSESFSDQLVYSMFYRATPGDPIFLDVDLRQTSSSSDLAILVLPHIENNAVPQIFVSFDEGNRQPSSLQAVNYSSIYSSHNIIFIPSEKLFEVQTLYVGLVCLQFLNCKGFFKAEHPKQFTINLNEQNKIQLEAVRTAVVRFHTSFEEAVDRIVIHIGTMQEDIYKMNFFLNLGNEIPYTGHSAEFSLMPWSEGAMIIIYKDSPLFCRNCNYTMSISITHSNQSEQMTFEVRDLIPEVKLEEGKAFLDGVNRNKTNTYSYAKTGIANSLNDISVDVQIKNGQVKVVIACDNKKFDVFNESVEGYAIDKPRSIILLQGKDYQRCQNGVYHISIYGLEDSVYSVQIDKTKNRNVSIDVPVAGVIAPGGTMNHLFYVKQKLSKQLRVSLTSSSSLEMKMSPCENVNDCKGLFPDEFEPFHNNDYSKPSADKFEFKLERVEDKQIAVIDMSNDDNCYPLFIKELELVPLCVYNVLLQSNDTEPVNYWLELELEELKHLSTEVVQDETISRNETLYFIFAPIHLDISEVTIQLSLTSGRVEGYISRRNKYPDESNAETILPGEGNITFNDHELIGNYFIAIKGLESSSFSLKASVLKKNQTQSFVRALISKVPQTGALHANDGYSPTYYGFYLNLDIDWKGSLNVHIRTNNGNAVFFGMNNNGTPPQPSNSMWTSNNQTIVITSDDLDFVRKGVYHVGVFDSDSEKQIEEEIEFLVEYYLETVEYQLPIGLKTYDHMFLFPTSFYNATLDNNQIDYYKAFILTEYRTLTLSKEGNVDIFISLSLNNKYPSENRFTYSTKSTNKDSIELSESDLVKTCQKQDLIVGVCRFYVAVVPREMKEISYQISLTTTLKKSRQANSMKFLEDKDPITLPIPQENIDLFYFYTLPSDASYIKLICTSRDVEIYVKLFDNNTNISLIENIEVPSASSYDYMAQSNGKGDILTLPYILTEVPRLVIVAIYFLGLSEDSLADYTIMLSSHVDFITLGQKYYSRVQSEQYTYFALVLVPQYCKLIISADLIGDNNNQELQVVVASTFDWKLPTLKSSSSFYDITELYSSKFIQMPKASAFQYMSGIWVIGVYSKKSSEFSLITLCAGDSITELTGDQPVTFGVPPDSIGYYIYNPQTSNPLNIHFSSSAHLFPYYITAIQKNEDIISNLPNKTNHRWSKASDIDPKTCNNCLYIIAVDRISTDILDIAFQIEFQMEFYLTISERNNQTIVVESGYPTNSRLSPGGSNIISITHMVIEDVYAVITSEAEKLEISLEISASSVWKIELLCNNQTKVIKIPSSDDTNFSAMSQDKLYQNTNTYIQIKNPIDVDIRYALTVVPIRDVYKIRNPIEFDIRLKISQGIIFYSENENEILELEFESDLKRLYYESDVPTLDLMMQAYYLSENGSEIYSESLPIYKTNTFAWYRQEVFSNDALKLSFRESVKQKSIIFKTNSKIGKFLFLITNPSEDNLLLQMTVSSKLNNVLPREPNFNETYLLQPGQDYTYKIAFPGPGAWYLWENHMIWDSIQLNIQDGIDMLERETNMTELGLGAYKETIGEGEQFRLIKASVKVETPIEWKISSLFLPGLKSYNYSLIQNENQSFVEVKENGTVIYVHFNPAVFKEDNFQDTLVYTVQVCAQEDSNLVISDDNCLTLKSEEFYIYMKNETQLEVRELLPGKYLVLPWITVRSQGHVLRSFPAGSGQFEIKSPFQLDNAVLPNKSTEESVGESRDDKSSQSSRWSTLSVGGVLLIAIVVVILIVVMLLFCRRNQKRERQEKGCKKENELADMEDSGEFLSSIKKKEELSS